MSAMSALHASPPSTTHAASGRTQNNPHLGVSSTPTTTTEESTCQGLRPTQIWSVNIWEYIGGYILITVPPSNSIGAGAQQNEEAVSSLKQYEYTGSCSLRPHVVCMFMSDSSHCASSTKYYHAPTKSSRGRRRPEWLPDRLPLNSYLTLVKL